MAHVTPDGRCSRSDLPVEWCAHCRAEGRVVTASATPVPQRPSTSRAVALPPSGVRARYPGTCPACTGRVVVGDEIATDEGGRWVHAECVELEVGGE